MDKDKSLNSHYSVAMAVLFIGTVTVISDIYVTQPILPVLSKEFSVSPDIASLAVTANITALSIALLFYGPLSDLIGRKQIMSISSILLPIPTLMIVFIENFNLFLIMRALQGVFAGGIASIAIAYINEEFPEYMRGKAIGIYIGAMITAGLTGRLAGGLITAYSTYKTMFLCFAILNLIGALLIIFLLPPSKRFVANKDILSSLRGMKGHFNNRYLVGAFIIAFFLFFTFTGGFTYITFHLSMHPFNLTTSEISLIFLVYVSGFLSPLAGSLSARHGRQRLIIFGLSTALLGIFLTIANNLIFVILGLLLLAAGLFITQPSANALIGDKAE
ncbi:MAG: MFS transporter, partial [Thermodesulfovibrionales bacterium]|nr:MFS transporter [Thermodesulfovibrionales bacterium]